MIHLKIDSGIVINADRKMITVMVFVTIYKVKIKKA